MISTGSVSCNTTEVGTIDNAMQQPLLVLGYLAITFLYSFAYVSKRKELIQWNRKYDAETNKIIGRDALYFLIKPI
ncbi:hypothetical protein D917_05258 [Trichinella nativa]|uniref:Uncharacterized protein n=1 Tax=Trichinella nativa TaxID=6335 RepID=A0A1Y3EWP3_9BILA|nr:hypothetical protein D917_05258 [Trichinella nativa]